MHSMFNKKTKAAYQLQDIRNIAKKIFKLFSGISNTFSTNLITTH